MTKTKLLIGVVLALGMLMGLGPDAQALLIDGVTATASSEYSLIPGHEVEKAVDGSGLNTANNPPTHSTVWSDFWETEYGQSSAWIEFDLHASYDVDSFRVWNINFASPYNGRGAKDVNISTKADGGTWSNPTAFVFEMATGMDTYTGQLFSDLDWDGVRYIKFDILNTYQGYDHAGHFGLSEVQFYSFDNGDQGSNAVPEPATIVLLGSGLIGALGLRRRSV